MTRDSGVVESNGGANSGSASYAPMSARPVASSALHTVDVARDSGIKLSAVQCGGTIEEMVVGRGGIREFGVAVGVAARVRINELKFPGAGVGLFRMLVNQDAGQVLVE